jgi:hypothetical protein
VATNTAEYNISGPSLKLRIAAVDTLVADDIGSVPIFTVRSGFQMSQRLKADGAMPRTQCSMHGAFEIIPAPLFYELLEHRI